ncbi:hypothetical protein DV103_08375, partial [Bifidobacterium animalis subsp. lactis]|nr:hypothetical protein [Bifidobacterium animalis subsp. lactis]
MGMNRCKMIFLYKILRKKYWHFHQKTILLLFINPLTVFQSPIIKRRKDNRMNKMIILHQS